MKRILTILILLTFVIVFTGCSTEESSSTGGSDNNGESVVPVYTPPSGGIVYILSAGISQIFSDNEFMPDVQLSIQGSSGETEIIQSVIDSYAEGKAAFGAAESSSINKAYNGTNENIEGEHKELTAVGYINGAPIHLVVHKNSDINSYADLQNKTIGVSPNSAFEKRLKDILEKGYGYTEGEDYKLLPYGFGEVQQGMQDKSLDAGVLMGGVPSPLVRELQSLTDDNIRVLSLDHDVIDKLDYSEVYYSEVEPGTYKNQEKKLMLPFLPGIVFTHEDTSEELVYNYLDAMLSKPEELKEIHPAANISSDNILQGVEIPLHPGAEKYLLEKNIIEE